MFLAASVDMMKISNIVHPNWNFLSNDEYIRHFPSKFTFSIQIYIFHPNLHFPLKFTFSIQINIFHPNWHFPSKLTLPIQIDIFHPDCAVKADTTLDPIQIALISLSLKLAHFALIKFAKQIHGIYIWNIIYAYCIYMKYHICILHIYEISYMHIAYIWNIIYAYCIYMKYYICILHISKILYMHIAYKLSITLTWSSTICFLLGRRKSLICGLPGSSLHKEISREK